MTVSPGGGHREEAPLLAVESLSKTYQARRSGRLRPALTGVSLTVDRQEIVGVVGESGCGKSTLARCIGGVIVPSGGEIRFEGRAVTDADARARREIRRRIQMVFQDPYASLNPRKRLAPIVAEPLRSYGVPRKERTARAVELLSQVGLSAEDADRYPKAFSGGQRQRVGIARAIALRPLLLIADEPVSALDASIQAQVLNLLMDLREQHGLAILLISHDLSVVQHVADRVLVMCRGRVVETGPTTLVYANPSHPYSQLLLSSSELTEAALDSPANDEDWAEGGANDSGEDAAVPRLVEIEPGHWVERPPVPSSQRGVSARTI